MIASLGYLLVALYHNINDENAIRFTATTVTYFSISVVLSLGINLIAGLNWSLLIPANDGTRDHSLKTELQSNIRLQNQQLIRLRIWLLSNIGKYLPGNVFHYVGRYVLASREGLTRQQILVSMLLEVLVVTTAGSIIVLLGLAGISALTFLKKISLMDHISQIAFSIIFSATLLYLLYLYRSTTGIQHLKSALTSVGTSRLCLSLAIASMQYFIAGLSTLVLLHSFGNAGTSISLLDVTSIYAFAFLFGYLLPGAPGGMGVREIALMTLISPYIGSAVAVSLVILLRVSSILGDIIGYSIGWLLGAGNKKS